MSKQDRGGVRTAAELERKYNFAGMQKAMRQNTVGLTKTNQELENFVNQTLGSLENVQNQIDGRVDTYYYSGVPSLSTLPAIEWNEEDYPAHVGDLYYDEDTGYAYRFIYKDGVYSWEKTEDGIAEALAIANAAKDTADSKRRIFVAEPVPPYDIGDLWLKEKEIYVCQTSKDEGETFEADDFTTATDYANNGALNDLGIKVDQQTEVIAYLQSISITTETLEAEVAKLGYASIETLEATEARIAELESVAITTETLEAEVGKFGYMSAETADLEYARIDKTNIGKGWVEELLVLGAFLAEDVNSATGSFSKYLTGVRIIGDLIEADTLRADTLILKGEDGLYRRLNINALDEVTVDSDPKYQEGLDGSILVKESVTAEKINVADLFAQSITSTGDFNLGAKGALSYDAETDDLTIRAKSITIGTSEVVTEENLNDIVTTLEGVVEFKNAAVNGSSTVINGGAIATGTITADQIASNTITAEKIDIESLFAKDIVATGSISGLKYISTGPDDYNCQATMTLDGGELTQTVTDGGATFTTDVAAHDIELSYSTTGGYLARLWMNGNLIEHTVNGNLIFKSSEDGVSIGESDAVSTLNVYGTIKEDGTALSAKYAPISHSHDNYALSEHTHSEYAPTEHTHNYAGSSSAGGDANNALKLDGYSLSSSGHFMGVIPYVGIDGAIDIGQYIDFHLSSGTTEDHDGGRLMADGTNMYYNDTKVSLEGHEHGWTDFPVTVSSNTAFTDTGYSARHNASLNLVQLRFYAAYKPPATVSANTEIVLGTVPSTYAPAFQHALSAYANLTDWRATINSSGQIIARCGSALSAGTTYNIRVNGTYYRS